MTLVLVLIVLLALLGVLGAVVEGLLWLVAAILLLALGAAAFGYYKFRGWSRRSS